MAGSLKLMHAAQAVREKQKDALSLACARSLFVHLSAPTYAAAGRQLSYLDNEQITACKIFLNRSMKVMGKCWKS